MNALLDLAPVVGALIACVGMHRAYRFLRDVI